MPTCLSFRATVLAAGVLLAGAAFADEAAIRKSLTERFANLPKIDEVTRSPVPGLWEVRYGGTEIIYTDDQGQYLLQGSLIDVKSMNNLTEERIDKLTAIDFGKLPLKDAFVIKQGSGARKLAVFVDPNCGFCKRFERDLVNVKDVTVYTFLMPILGPDSTVKARDIWCAKDSGKTWRAWMVEGVLPPKVADKCDAGALERNVDFGRKFRVNGTPALVFEDGTRKPGALPAAEVERLLAIAARKS
jgi:thiol:disulfide interchange protein DsbC